MWQLRAAPFFGLTMGDAQSYHSWGLEILAGDWAGSEIFYQAPLYPYFLGAVYALFGSGPARGAVGPERARRRVGACCWRLRQGVCSRVPPASWRA